MQIRDPGWRQFGSGIRTVSIPDPGSRIRIKEFKYFNPDPGSGINILDPQYCPQHWFLGSKCSSLESLMRLTYNERIFIKSKQIHKSKQGFVLDFSTIGQKKFFETISACQKVVTGAYWCNFISVQHLVLLSLLLVLSMYRTGYKLYSLNSVDKLDMIYESPCRDVTIVERLFSSSLIGKCLPTILSKLRDTCSRILQSLGFKMFRALKM